MNLKTLENIIELVNSNDLEIEDETQLTNALDLNKMLTLAIAKAVETLIN